MSSHASTQRNTGARPRTLHTRVGRRRTDKSPRDRLPVRLPRPPSPPLPRAHTPRAAHDLLRGRRAHVEKE
eukprot:6467184-Prymnesium_polylepis.1